MSERFHAPLTLLALLAGILFFGLQGGRPLTPTSPDVTVSAEAVADGATFAGMPLHGAFAPHAMDSRRLAGPSGPPVLPTLRTAAASPLAIAHDRQLLPAAWPGRSHAPCARPQTGPPAA